MPRLTGQHDQALQPADSLHVKLAEEQHDEDANFAAIRAERKW